MPGFHGTANLRITAYECEVAGIHLNGYSYVTEPTSIQGIPRSTAAENQGGGFNKQNSTSSMRV